MSDNTLSVKMDMPPEALEHARALGAVLDPRCGEQLAGPLMNLVAQLSVNTAISAVNQVLPRLVQQILVSVMPELARMLDARNAEHTRQLVAAHLANQPAPPPPAPAGPLQVEIVAMPPAPPKTVKFIQNKKGEVTAATVLPNS